MASSIQAAIDACESAFSGTSGVTRVYDHEPTTPVDGALTIVCSGMDPDNFTLEARVYVRVGDAKDSQERLYAIVQAADAKLTSAFGPSRWSFGYVPESQVLVATWAGETGREDYY